MRWPDFHRPRWDRLVAEAKEAQTELPENFLFASDRDHDAMKQTQFALKVLGFGDRVQVTKAPFEDLRRPEGIEKGFLVMNPPYGERLGEEEELMPLYKQMGDTFKRELQGWNAAVFTGSPTLAKAIGLRTTKKIPLWNGALECRLLTFEMFKGFRNPKGSPAAEKEA